MIIADYRLRFDDPERKKELDNDVFSVTLEMARLKVKLKELQNERGDLGTYCFNCEKSLLVKDLRWNKYCSACRFSSKRLKE